MSALSQPKPWPAPGVYDAEQPDTSDAHLDHDLWMAMADYEARFGFDALRQRSAENLMELADGRRRARKAA